MGEKIRQKRTTLENLTNQENNQTTFTTFWSHFANRLEIDQLIYDPCELLTLNESHSVSIIKYK